jgi:hypothetical protein
MISFFLLHNLQLYFILHALQNQISMIDNFSKSLLLRLPYYYYDDENYFNYNNYILILNKIRLFENY